MLYEYSLPNRNMNDVITQIALKHSSRPNTPFSRWPIFVFIVATICCLLLSSIYHTFNDFSPKARSLLSRVDYAGVSFLIAGSCFPPFYYIFYCEGPFAIIYLVGISVASVAVFISSLMPKFDTAKF